MADEDKFVVLGLKDKKSKELAKALSNEKAQQILSKLAEKKMSPTDLSKALDLPLSTVQYNLDVLTKSGLIKQKWYKWSKKGNKIRLYEPARKIIVLSPERTDEDSLKALLSKIVPAVLGVAAVVGFGIQKFFSKPSALITITEEIFKTPSLTAESAPMAAGAAELAMDSAQDQLVEQTVQLIPAEQNLALIFFLGALLATIAIATTFWLKNR